MKEQFVPYNLALELKELGFDEKCIAFYKKYTSEWEFKLRDYPIYKRMLHDKKEFLAPLYQQAFDWFRNKGYISCIHINNSYEIVGGIHTLSYPNPYHIDSEVFRSYEEVREACLNKLIEISKNNSKWKLSI